MASNTFTPRRSLARPRPVNAGFSTASSPNLAASYSALQSAAPSSQRLEALARKASLSALTVGSLATIPDASEGYGLSTVLDEDLDSPTVQTMPPFTPQRDIGHELDLGDVVNVPGDMYGMIKFVGSIPGKKGTFVGVELSDSHASKGKNNGDVDG